MKQFYCLSCDHMWMDLDHEGCPECQSMDVASDEDFDVSLIAPPNPSWDDDGHFEGEFPSLPHGINDRIE